MAAVPILDLGRQFEGLREELTAAVLGVLERQHFILGPNVAALEREAAAFCGVEEAVGVASGTDALLLSLSAAGVGLGDEVIVPAFSFIATADVVSLLGATPVFADIEPDSFNLDAESARARVTPRTKAIVPVHLYGRPAAMEGVLALARERGLAVVEDCAQAMGARWEGVPVGSLGDYGCLSFFPSKNLGGCGDGGMILVNDREKAERLRMLRAHGSRRKYHSEVQGWNSRLDELQAAVLRVKLPHLPAWNDARRARASAYGKLLAGLVEVPEVVPGHMFHQYTVRVADRERVAQALARAGVQTFVYYPVPLHLQPMYAHLGYRAGALPEAERAAREALSLPMFPELRADEQERVAGALENALTPALQEA